MITLHAAKNATAIESLVFILEPPRPLGLDIASVAEFHAVGNHRWSAALRRRTGAGNRVAGLHGLARPTIGAKMIQTHHFDFPLHNLTFLVFDIQKDECMWIGPFELGHSAADRDGMLGVIHRRGVMGASGSCH